MWSTSRIVLALLLSSSFVPRAVDAACELLEIAEKVAHVDSPLALAQQLLGRVQDDLKSGKGPHVDVASCKDQSVDDIHCEIPVGSTSVKLGTDVICDAGCDKWPCVAGCSGVDVAICWTGDFVLCKVGCLGIHSCVSKCEHAIVDPCKEKLVNECKQKCDAAFDNCKSGCEKELSMQINVDFERLRGQVTSTSVKAIDFHCSGNGVTDPLKVSATSVVEVDDIGVYLKIVTKDAGISSTNHIVLDNVHFELSVPLSGTLNCGLIANPRGVHISAGQLSILSFDLDVHLQLNKGLDTVTRVICGGLSVCRDTLFMDKINKAIKKSIVEQVPKKAAKQIQPAFNQVLKMLTCPPILHSLRNRTEEGVDLIV
jgi:hypothetical protein